MSLFRRISLAAAFTTLLGILSAYSQGEVEYLNSNMLNAGFGIGGNLFSKLDSFVTLTPTDTNALWDLSEVPKGTNVRAINTATLWMTGLDSGGNVYCAGQVYKYAGSDFYDGPIADVYDSTYRNYYSRVFKITKAQIVHYQTLTFPANPSDIDSAILLWPGIGNPYVASTFGVTIAHGLAPFVDVDHDQRYNPLNGDYPAICGDEAVFFVFNDVRGPHGETEGDKLGMEIRGMAYEFTDSSNEDIPFVKRAINNTVFVQYDIENKSSTSYNNFYAALFESPDIGCFENDRVGCDTIRNMMFAYKGSTPDLSCQGFTGYAPYLAAQGIIILNQKMEDFVYFLDGSDGGWAPGDPISCATLTNYTTGYWSDGTPFTYGGFGYHSGGLVTKYCYPGDPNDTSQWSEVNSSEYLPPGVRRMAGGIGPMNFNAGEIKHFDFAFTTSYDSTATMYSIVDTLKRDADIVQAFYNNTVAPCQNQLDTLLSINEVNRNENLLLSVYPNPSSSLLNVIAQGQMTGRTSAAMYDLTGTRVWASEFNLSENDNRFTVNTSSFAQGVYILDVENDQLRGRTKVVICR